MLRHRGYGLADDEAITARAILTPAMPSATPPDPPRLVGFTRAWYAQEALRELVLIYPVYAIMMGRLGVTPLELAVLLGVWSATALAFEVPTGTLADRLPRRWILIAGQGLKAACFLLWWLMPSFGGFLAGFVAWGIGGSLRSGAAEALLHDRLRELGRADLFVQVYGRGEAAGAAAVTLAMALGGWAATRGYTLPLVLSAAAPIAAALVTLLAIDEPAPSSVRARNESYLATLRAGLGEIRASADLRVPMLFLCTAGLVYEVGEEYFGPLLEEVGFSLAAIGLIGAATNLARATGALTAERLGIETLRGVAGLYAAAALLLAAAALASGWLAMVALVLFVAAAAAGKVLLQGRLQYAIEGHARATITSVAGFGQELAGVPLLLVLGALAQRSTWVGSFVWLAAGLLVAAISFGAVAGGATRRQR